MGNHFPTGTTPTPGRAQSQHLNLNLRVQTLGVGDGVLFKIRLMSLENRGHLKTPWRHSPFLHILVLFS